MTCDELTRPRYYTNPRHAYLWGLFVGIWAGVMLALSAWALFL